MFSSDPEMISLRQSLFIPGMFHIVDGITKDMLKECKTWEDIQTQFESVLSFFHMHHRRTMFVQSCVSLLPELRGFQTFFSTGPPLFEGGCAWGFCRSALRGF